MAYKSENIKSISTYDLEHSIERMEKLKEMLEMQNKGLLNLFESHIDNSIVAMEILLSK
ncbi:hypothetical protein M2150_001645 [Lachnospiraceae bacterium PM6-15]|uniref:hypothetical protein n=1 Tax=Ohessyouella blattaphilus TaxID=2949333 RepID=UPI003E2041D1